MTTALITTFEVGSEAKSVGFRLVAEGVALGDLSKGEYEVDRSIVANAPRWSSFFFPNRSLANRGITLRGADQVPLGSLVRVSRGIATGCNEFFVMTAEEAERRGLGAFSRPAITMAREVLASPGVLRATPERRVVIDLPVRLDSDTPGMVAAREYVRTGEKKKVNERYLCAHRKPWWALRVGRPPRAVATYMARQAPVFAMNPDGLVILNIAHGLYPRGVMTDEELMALVLYLNSVRSCYRGEGRTYHGGLEKFEPREMESLRVPCLEDLRALAEEMPPLL